MQEHPKTVQAPPFPDQDAYDRIMRIARRDPITGPTLRFAADAFKDAPTPSARIGFASGVNSPRI